MSEFQDFEILITAEGDEYFAQVVHSPAGESGRCKLELPFDQSQILLRLENAILRSVKPVRSQRIEADLRAIGDGLFRALLTKTDEIRLLYSNSRNALAVGTGLRVKLRIDAENLGALPWEYFYDDLILKDYLGLDAHTSLVRYLPMARPIPQIAVQGQLRILGMAANPRGSRRVEQYASLDVTNERSRIDKAIRQLHESGAVHFQWVAGDSYDDLFNAAAYKGPWHIFHFVGHGGVDDTGEGFVVLAGESGEAEEFSASKLIRILRFASLLRLVVLNCCDSARGSSSLAKKLVFAGVPAVLAMQFPISDQAAIEFASAFYVAIANGHAVDAAVTHARIKMQHKSAIEWGIPVLYMRTSDGRIFERQVTDNGQGATVTRAKNAPQPVPTLQLIHAKPVDGAQTGRKDEFESDAFSALAFEAEKFTPEQDSTFFAHHNLDSLDFAVLEQLAEAGNRLIKKTSNDRAIRDRLAKIYFELGRRYQKQNSMNKAFVNIANAIELDETETEYLCARANIYARSEQYELAMADLERAIQIAPTRSELHWAKAVICLLVARNPIHHDQLNVAIQALSLAIRFDPRVAKYYSARAAAHVRLGELSRAQADLDLTIGLDPNDGKAYYNRGHLRLRLKDERGAIEDFQNGADRGSAEALNELRQLLADKGTGQ